MDIHNYKKRLEKVEKRIKNSNISENNKKIIFDYEKQMFIREFSLPRIERCKMIEFARHPMDRALIAALYETGCRIGEMASLQIKNAPHEIRY